MKIEIRRRGIMNPIEIREQCEIADENLRNLRRYL